MRTKRHLLTLGLLTAIIFNALPVAAQQKQAIPVLPKPMLDGVGTSEVYRNLRKSGQNAAFPSMLKRVAGKEAEDIEAALEAQAVMFFEAFAEKKIDTAKIYDKARALNRKKYEESKKNTPQTKTAPKKVPRAYGKSFAGASPFAGDLAADPQDDPRFETVETETGMSATGKETKTMDMADSTVTRTEELKQNGGSNDGKEMFMETVSTTKTDIVSKTGNKKVNLTEKLEWAASFAMCPDKEGRLSGHGRAGMSSQAVTTADGKAAAVSQSAMFEFRVTGYVNDDAVFTHFTIEVSGTETISGMDRAREYGFLENDKGLRDGSGTIKAQIDNCKPPYQTERNEYGMTRTVEPVLGPERITQFDPVPGSELLSKLYGYCTGMFLTHLSLLMMGTIPNIKNGECVDVECTAPKNTLKPGETIDVTAVSVSRKELDKFNAKLKAKGNASPDEQFGTPTAVFVFTADAGGGGIFLVESISRRGIGLGMIEFGKEGENDLDKDKCDGNWHGTIDITRSFEEVIKETTKPGDLRSNPQLSGWKEVINRQKYEGKVRIEDVKLATANVWLLNAATDIAHSKYYLDQGYFTEPNQCGWYVNKTIKDSGGVERREEGSLTSTGDVTIQFVGNEYRVSTGIKEIKGVFMGRSWHHPSGYCQDGNNKPSDIDTTGETRFDRVPISFDGKIDPLNPDVLTGTKTAVSEDGKETVTIKWSIKKCSPVKAKLKPTGKKK